MMTPVALLFYFITSVFTLQCKDENNNPIDWFVAYKLPKLKHENVLLEEGVAYSYMTSQNNSKWFLSEISINSSNSIIGNTISNLYDSDENVFHVLFNDEPPTGKTNEEKGHTKGLVLANKDGGLWLIHSTPHFPATDGYYFPKTGMTYGQSFLCISLNLNNLNEVGQQLKYNEPNIYSVNIPTSLETSVPDLIAAANNKTVISAPWYRQAEVRSQENQSFLSFAKSRNFGKDLYSSWVASALSSDLYVETWRKGPGNLPSNCNNKYKVNNIQEINLFNITFPTTDDHSKWAVSENLEKSQWICIGDINRQEHQLKRGGGTVCINNKKLATNYLKSVYHVENC